LTKVDFTHFWLGWLVTEQQVRCLLLNSAQLIGKNQAHLRAQIVLLSARLQNMQQTEHHIFK